jgi:hypothetical protein
LGGSGSSGGDRGSGEAMTMVAQGDLLAIPTRAKMSL